MLASASTEPAVVAGKALSMRVHTTAACRFFSDGLLRERLSGEIEAELRQGVEATPGVKQLNGSLLIDQTDEGLCI